MLNCIDNSGASIVECVANLRMKRAAKTGTQFPMAYGRYSLRNCRSKRFCFRPTRFYAAPEAQAQANVQPSI